MKPTYDILLHIISLSWYAKDAVQLISTCRVLYQEGPKIALKKTVSISTREQLPLFLRFLRADNSSRCRYLRKLELAPCFSEPDVIQELIETLPLLSNIQYMRLTEAEEILNLHPALTAAFCSLATLRHIEFTGVDVVETCQLLSRLHSPLIKANITFVLTDVKPWDDLDDDNEWERTHPVTLLRNFASTLEELHCIAWYTTERIFLPAEVFPNMRKLSIENHYFPLRIGAFIRAFPNLTNLYLDTAYQNSDASESNLEAMRESHDTNVAQQLSINNSCGTWAHLERFTGALFDLYAIGLTSHIRRVTIIDRLEDGPRTDMLATVLRYARPLHLKLEDLCGSMLGDTNRGFIFMLREGCGAKLVNLDVCIYFGVDDQEKDLKIIIENLVSALAGLPLKFLELRFETRELDPTPMAPSDFERMIARRRGRPEPPEPISAPLSPAELSLQALDMDALIARLEAISSLEAAHVVLPDSRRRGDGNWMGHERTITKGASRLPGRKQWESWVA